jgi:hypothetical protein
MRTRVKMNGLVSHTTPNGKSYSSGRNKCEQNIKKLEKLIDEGWEITGAKKKSSEGTFKLFGTLECKFEIPVEILIKAGFRK